MAQRMQGGKSVENERIGPRERLREGEARAKMKHKKSAWRRRQRKRGLPCVYAQHHPVFRLLLMLVSDDRKEETICEFGERGGALRDSANSNEDSIAVRSAPRRCPAQRAIRVRS